MKALRILTLLAVAAVLLTACQEDKRPTRTTTTSQELRTDAVEQEKSRPAEQIGNDTNAAPVETAPVDTAPDAAPADTAPNAAPADTARAITKPHAKKSTGKKSSNEDDGLPMPLILAVLALVAAAASAAYSNFVRKVAETEFAKIDKWEKDIERELGKKVTKDSFAKTSKKVKDTEGDYERLVERLERLENVLRTAPWGSSEGPSAPSASAGVPSASAKEGYFGVPKTSTDGMAVLFNDFPRSVEDGAYFKVWHTSENTCDFAPIRLEHLQSIDAMEAAVDCVGERLSYAKSMRVIANGQAVKRSRGDVWEIVPGCKAKVELKA